MAACELPQAGPTSTSVAVAPSDVPPALIIGYPLPLSGLRIHEFPLAVEFYGADYTDSGGPDFRDVGRSTTALSKL
jgi:hypothetical protein